MLDTRWLRAAVGAGAGLALVGVASLGASAANRSQDSSFDEPTVAVTSTQDPDAADLNTTLAEQLAALQAQLTAIQAQLVQQSPGTTEMDTEPAETDQDTTGDQESSEGQAEAAEQANEDAGEHAPAQTPVAMPTPRPTASPTTEEHEGGTTSTSGHDD